MTAIISPCGKYRYRLERELHPNVAELAPPSILRGKVIGFFGVNPSIADAAVDDATVRKWIGFSRVWGASRFIVGNAFAFRSTDVKALATVDDAFGPDIGDHTASIIGDADLLVPCWGNVSKVPPELQFAFDVLLDALVSSGKPVLHFGKTKAGDPRHPLTLGYDTLLTPWENA